MEPVVETVNLTKTYKGTTVVDNLNLRIDEGEIFGFLGPNGAGKTTTILMLLGLTEPTSGVARIGGFNSTREPLKAFLAASNAGSGENSRNVIARPSR